MLLQESGNFIVQNMFYNGWTHGHYISSIYAFAPDGRVRICAINSPGSWHDSQQSEYGVYPKLKDIFNRYSARVVVDSAFKSSGACNYLLKSIQQDFMGTPLELRIGRAATSVRQLSEWGMQ